jgi:hypothetical protein
LSLLGLTIVNSNVETNLRIELLQIRKIVRRSRIGLRMKVGQMPRKKHAAKLMASAITVETLVIPRYGSRAEPGS